MNRQLRRTRFMGIISLGTLGIVIWQFVLGPRFAEPTTLWAQRDSVNSSTRSLIAQAGQHDTLVKNAQEQAKLAAGLNTAVPCRAEIPALDKQIQRIAASVGMQTNAATVATYSSMVPLGQDGTSAKPGAAKPGTVDDPSATNTTPTPGATGAAKPTPAPTTGNGTVTLPSNGDPCATDAGTWQSSVTIEAFGTVSQLLAFVDGVAHGPRAITLGQVSLSQTTIKPGIYKATIAGTVYAAATVPTKVPTPPTSGASPKK